MSRILSTGALSPILDNVLLAATPAETQAVLRALLATDFNAFIEFCFRTVRPGTSFRSNWHIEAMAHKLMQIANGEIKRLIITLPPRNLKSICASVALPAWVLGRNPAERIVAVSYSEQLARTHANDFRMVVKDPLYQATFPEMQLSRDTDRQVITRHRGGRIAASLDGTLTGLGGNLIIIDDPLKIDDAYSEAVRASVIEWYRSTLLTRLDDKSNDRIVVVMQRVHQQDLVGYLMEQGGFEVLNLPAIATEEASFDLGGGRTYSRMTNELLHPEHEPVDVLRQLRSEMGPVAFSAQYQQQPIRQGGTIIRRRWLKFYQEPLAFSPGDRIIMSWDIAYSETASGNYSACVVLHQRGDTFFVLEVIRGRIPFDLLMKKILEVKARYGSGTLLIEDTSVSIGLIQNLRAQSIAVVSYRPETDKLARLIAQSDLFSAGAVYLPERAPWLDAFLSELLAFPGRYDDQVDAISQGLAWGRQAKAKRAVVGFLVG